LIEFADGVDVLRDRLAMGTAVSCPSCGSSFVSIHGQAPVDWRCERCSAPPPLDPSEELEGRLLAAGVPPRFATTTHDGWVSKFGRPWPGALSRGGWHTASSVLIHGPTGTGKSGLAALLLAERIAAGGRGMWVSEDTLTSAERAAVAAERSRRPELAHFVVEHYELSQRAQWTPILILDGLFDQARAQSVSPWSIERSARLIAHRYDQRLLTVTTSNFSPGELEAIKKSLATRLLEGLRVRLGGDDRRFS
jgi:hypothetical protein